MAPHVLDRPIWNALATGWSALAQGGAAARRIDPRYGPFGAAADGGPDALAALADLVPADGALWIVEGNAITPPPGTRILREAALAQMVAEDVLGGTSLTPLTLDEADAGEMQALAALTQPGPFLSHTHRYGGFIGIRERGELIAMAGTRMRLPGYREVSGVCTHPDHRGKGHAGALMRIVARAVLARGETPFLHAYAANKSAIGLYETLGFRVRAEMRLMVVGR